MQASFPKETTKGKLQEIPSKHVQGHCELAGLEGLFLTNSTHIWTEKATYDSTLLSAPTVQLTEIPILLEMVSR